MKLALTIWALMSIAVGLMCFELVDAMGWLLGLYLSVPIVAISAIVTPKLLLLFNKGLSTNG